MITIVAHPNMEISHLRSSSGNLTSPADLSNNRRLSDSAICRNQDMVNETAEDELLKLRQWAMEAMKARPQSIVEPLLEDLQEVCGAPPMLRRESEGRDRNLRPISQGSDHLNTLPRRRPKHDRSSSPNSPDGRWSEFLVNGFRARPTSMYVLPPSSSAGKREIETANGSSSVMPSRLARSALIRKPVNRKGGQSPLVLPDEHEGASTPQSQQKQETPLLQDLTSSQAHSISSSSPSLVSRRGPPALQSLHLAYPSSNAPLVSPDQRTPRGKLMPGLSSPTCTSSSCGSDEEDGIGLRTPLDEMVPRRSSSVSRSSRTYTGDTPPINTLESNVAERVGVERGLDSLGSSANQTMQSMTGVNLVGRRGSLPAIEIGGDQGFKAFAVAPLISSDNIHSLQSPSSSDTAPNLTRSTLMELGQIDGITPPVSRKFVSHSASHSFSSVVSAGLEMGMGVGMASSALSGHLPITSSSGINSIAEPRFSRHTGSSPMDYQSFAAHLKMTDEQLQMTSVPAPPHYTPDAASDRAADEVTFAELDREDAELARRRTTGGMAASKRDNGVVGKRRHVRSGTHDPRNTGNASKGHHRLLSSISTFPGLAEEEVTQESDGSVLLHNLARLDIGSKAGMSSSIGTSSISDAIASGGFASTPLGTPLQSYRAMLSPDLDSTKFEGTSYLTSKGDDGSGAEKRSASGVGRDDVPRVAHAIGGTYNGGLMGMGGGGHFGPGVRAKIAAVLEALIAEVPLTHEENETVQLVEYGCLNSRSAQLMQPIISTFASRSVKQSTIALSQDSADDTAEGGGRGGYFDQQRELGSQRKPSIASTLSFQVTHEDSSNADFRPLNQLLESHSESYLDSHWQASHSPSLTNAIFSTFAARPFASRIAPPQTLHAGISLMDLHWTHTPINPNISSATTAQAELTTFLSARGSEFKRGGVLIMAYIARSEAAMGSSMVKDIWTTMSNILAPCIQRLVSCSMVKSDVARHLLSLPIHPRSAKQTKAVLKSVEETWKVEWSCGLGQAEEEEETKDEEKTSPLQSEPSPLRLPHPAWKAYNSGTLSRVPFTEHMIQLFKNLYESHFRTVLREKGKLSKGAVEFVLDSLWDVLFSRIVDQQPSPMKDVEIEVSIVALRRQ